MPSSPTTSFLSFPFPLSRFPLGYLCSPLPWTPATLFPRPALSLSLFFLLSFSLLYWDFYLSTFPCLGLDGAAISCHQSTTRTGQLGSNAAETLGASSKSALTPAWQYVYDTLCTATKTTFKCWSTTILTVILRVVMFNTAFSLIW